MSSDRLSDTLDQLGRRVAKVLDLTGIAEQEIERAVKRHPKAAKSLQTAFMLLRPPSLLLTKSESLYRWHARELLERVAKREDVGPGTEAEVMAALSEISLAFPLEANHQTLYERLFERCYPGSVGGQRAKEKWKGAADEIFKRLRATTGQRRYL